MASGVPAVGTQLLHYRVLSRLGAGGMGEVFLAEDTRLGRHVALKFLPSSDSTDPEARQRLVREAQAASVLRLRVASWTLQMAKLLSPTFR